MFLLWSPLTLASNWCDNSSDSIRHTMQVIQEKLSLPDCSSTMAKLPTLNSLDLSKSKLSDIRPLKEAKKIRVLLLNNNLITDLSPIRDLSLRWLDISYNPIFELESLSGIHTLETLWASFMDVKDIGALKGMKNLKYVSLEHNSIRDVSVFSSIKTVEFLGLAQNEIEDFHDLGKHPTLKFISIMGNPVRRCPIKGKWANICKKERERIE